MLEVNLTSRCASSERSYTLRKNKRRRPLLSVLVEMRQHYGVGGVHAARQDQLLPILRESKRPYLQGREIRNFLWRLRLASRSAQRLFPQIRYIRDWIVNDEDDSAAVGGPRHAVLPFAQRERFDRFISLLNCPCSRIEDDELQLRRIRKIPHRDTRPVGRNSRFSVALVTNLLRVLAVRPDAPEMSLAIVDAIVKHGLAVRRARRELDRILRKLFQVSAIVVCAHQAPARHEDEKSSVPTR